MEGRSFAGERRAGLVCTCVGRRSAWLPPAFTNPAFATGETIFETCKDILLAIVGSIAFGQTGSRPFMSVSARARHPFSRGSHTHKDNCAIANMLLI